MASFQDRKEAYLNTDKSDFGLRMRFPEDSHYRYAIEV